MSRQAWLDTSSLLEAISEAIVKCDSSTFSGLTSADWSTLTNLLSQLAIPVSGYQVDPRTPLAALSNNFISFISTPDRCGFMLRHEWFMSDTKPSVPDDFISMYVKVRMLSPISDIIRQVDYLSLQPADECKLFKKQLAVMKGLDTPYNMRVSPRDLFRSTDLYPGNISQMGNLATAVIAPSTFFVAEKNRILFGIRSNEALPAGPNQIVVPAWASTLQVTNARLYFTNSFSGTTIANVQVTTNANDVPTTITVPTDLNNMTINSDNVVSFSLSGGNINVELGVQMNGFCIAIDGDFSILPNRSQNYYTLNSVTSPNTQVDDFGLSHMLSPTRSQLQAAGQSEIFSDAMNVITTILITNYTSEEVAQRTAFTAPWYRFSERAHTLFTLNQDVSLNTKRLIVRHLWIITSFIAIFGRYFKPN